MNKKLPLISLFIMSIVSMFYWAFKPKELYEAKWNAPDTTLAITINGEISTMFPTNKNYTTSITCTSGTGNIEWNGTKWILTTSGITKGSTKCNANFITKIPTLAEVILDDNEIKTPLTIPGQEVSSHTLNDIGTQISNVPESWQSYYITYGTGWTANDVNFNLTGAAVTSDTYANSYSSLVGKYLTSNNIIGTGSSTAGTMKTTTNLKGVYYVVRATSSSFTYKLLGSNKNTTEAILASTEDDYGTSYYFRGVIKNNYVQFANKCWRIVRINGNGSVKLVLNNDNTSGDANPCATVVSSKSAFAHYSGSTNSTQFNGNRDDNTYVGLMYGTISATNYASAHANINKSTILTNLETWYKNNLASYESKLADTIWCNDKSTFTTFRNGSTYGTGLGYGTNRTGYGAYNRIYGRDTSVYANPSMICPNDNNGGKLSKFTVGDTINGNGNLTYKVGLLTADEAAFAGFVNGKSNYSTYLQENTDNQGWQTLTSCYFDGEYAMNFYVGVGSLSYTTVTSYLALRPAISLISATTISGGSGTSEDPYVIK